MTLLQYGIPGTCDYCIRLTRVEIQRHPGIRRPVYACSDCQHKTLPYYTSTIDDRLSETRKDMVQAA